MKNHIIKVKTTPATGVAVESVVFSFDVKRVIVHTAKHLLGELSHSTPGCNTREMLGTMYLNIKRVLEYWNTKENIQADMIRNAIRVLDMRIFHCEQSLKRDKWEEIVAGYYPLANDIVEEKAYKNYCKVGKEVIDSQYIGTTMEIMTATRRILVDSLITVSPDFE